MRPPFAWYHIEESASLFQRESIQIAQVSVMEFTVQGANLYIFLIGGPKVSTGIRNQTQKCEPKRLEKSRFGVSKHASDVGHLLRYLGGRQH